MHMNPTTRAPITTTAMRIKPTFQNLPKSRRQQTIPKGSDNARIAASVRDAFCLGAFLTSLLPSAVCREAALIFTLDASQAGVSWARPIFSVTAGPIGRVGQLRMNHRLRHVRCSRAGLRRRRLALRDLLCRHSCPCLAARIRRLAPQLIDDARSSVTTEATGRRRSWSSCQAEQPQSTTEEASQPSHICSKTN